MSVTERFIEVAKCASSMDSTATADDLHKLARQLSRQSDNRRCLRHGGSGVWVWVKNRLTEMGRIRKATPKFIDEPEGTRLTVELHFWPWDEEKYGPWPEEHTREKEIKSSPLKRIVEKNGQPIDRTAARVAKERKRK